LDSLVKYGLEGASLGITHLLRGKNKPYGCAVSGQWDHPEPGIGKTCDRNMAFSLPTVAKNPFKMTIDGYAPIALGGTSFHPNFCAGK
jgi:hypothetical protein